MLAKEFIRDNWELIENQDFDKLYNLDSYNRMTFKENGKVTSLMLEVGINPLDYMNYIPNYFLAYSNISKFEIPKYITGIGKHAFYACGSLESITIPDSVTEIDGGAFEGCVSLKSIIIPNSVIEIGDNAFNNCRFNSIEIKNPNCYLGPDSFYLSAPSISLEILKNVTLPAKYKSATAIRNIFGYKNTLELRKRVKFTWI